MSNSKAEYRRFTSIKEIGETILKSVKEAATVGIIFNGDTKTIQCIMGSSPAYSETGASDQYFVNAETLDEALGILIQTVERPDLVQIVEEIPDKKLAH